MLSRGVSTLLALVSLLAIGFVLLVGIGVAEAKGDKGKKEVAKPKVEAKAEGKVKGKEKAKEKGPDKEKATKEDKLKPAKDDKEAGKSDESHGKGMAMGKDKEHGKGEGLALGKDKQEGGLAVGKGHVEPARGKKTDMAKGKRAQLFSNAVKKKGPKANEQRKHAKRLAKLMRLEEIAKEKGNDKMLAKIAELRQKELQRHAKKMTHPKMLGKVKKDKAKKKEGK